MIETRETRFGLRRRRRCLNEVCRSKFTTAELVVKDGHHHDKSHVLVVTNTQAMSLLTMANDIVYALKLASQWRDQDVDDAVITKLADSVAEYQRVISGPGPEPESEATP